MTAAEPATDADVAANVAGHAATTPRPAAPVGVLQPRSASGQVTLTCLVCGTKLAAVRRDCRTCSPTCARRDAAARREARLAAEGRECEECGGQFVGGRSDRRYCGDRCRMRAYRRRRRTRPSDTPRQSAYGGQEPVT